MNYIDKVKLFERILKDGKKNILVLDIDDTILKANMSDLTVWKAYSSGKREAMSTEDFAKDPDAALSPDELDELGISYDFSEFNNPINIKKSIMQGTPLVKNLRLMDAHLEADWDLAFLTARSQEDAVYDALLHFLKFYSNSEFLPINKYLKRDCCAAINDTTRIYPGVTVAEKKANVLRKLCAEYNQVAFVDDDLRNVQYARALGLPNLKVIVSNPL